MQVSFVTFKDPSEMVSFLNSFESSMAPLMEITDYCVPQLDSLGYAVPNFYQAGNTGSLEGDRKSIVAYFGDFNWQQQPIQVKGIRLSDKISFLYQGFESIPDFLGNRTQPPSFINPDQKLFPLSPARQAAALTGPPSPLPVNWNFSPEAIYLQQITDYQDSINSNQYPKGSVVNPGDVAEQMFINATGMVYYPVVLVKQAS